MSDLNDNQILILEMVDALVSFAHDIGRCQCNPNETEHPQYDLMREVSTSTERAEQFHGWLVAHDWVSTGPADTEIQGIQEFVARMVERTTLI